MMDMSKQVGPFVGVSRDALREFPNGRTFRFLVYGAYNAFGLIGPEKNGIAVLDEDNKAVLVDELVKAPSGYYGPTKQQLDRFEEMLDEKFTFDQLCADVNSSDRARNQLVD